MPRPQPNESEELRFNFRSGRLCLAFVATVGERWRAGIERLRGPEDLTRWYREAGLVDVAIPVSPQDLTGAREVREAIHRLAKDRIEGGRPSPADQDLLNRAAAHPPLVPVLSAGSVSLAPPSEGAARAALSTVARDAIDMLAHVVPTRLRECASDECGLLFVDTSRPGMRRWCSSQACGGRVRSASYRRRGPGRT